MNRKCLILLSYIEHSDDDFVQDLAMNADYIIAADGGQMKARTFGLRPDCVIGDFDSTDTDETFDCLYITYPAEKNLTDTEACIRHALERGYHDITILGGIGGRLDHTLGNIAMLLCFTDDETHIRFIDRKNSMELIRNESIELVRDPDYRYFALVPVDEKASGVSISGAKYDLSDAVLSRASTLGISNEFKEDHVRITVTDGTLLIVRSSDVN